MKECDKNGDGVIDYIEFIEMKNKSSYWWGLWLFVIERDIMVWCVEEDKGNWNY